MGQQPGHSSACQATDAAANKPIPGTPSFSPTCRVSCTLDCQQVQPGSRAKGPKPHWPHENYIDANCNISGGEPLVQTPKPLALQITAHNGEASSADKPGRRNSPLTVSCFQSQLNRTALHTGQLNSTAHIPHALVATADTAVFGGQTLATRPLNRRAVSLNKSN